MPISITEGFEPPQYTDRACLDYQNDIPSHHHYIPMRLRHKKIVFISPVNFI